MENIAAFPRQRYPDHHVRTYSFCGVLLAIRHKHALLDTSVQRISLTNLRKRQVRKSMFPGTMVVRPCFRCFCIVFWKSVPCLLGSSGVLQEVQLFYKSSSIVIRIFWSPLSQASTSVVALDPHTAVLTARLVLMTSRQKSFQTSRNSTFAFHVVVASVCTSKRILVRPLLG